MFFNSVISKLMVFTLAISFIISAAIVSTVIFKQYESIHNDLSSKAETQVNQLTRLLINPVYDLKVHLITEFLSMFLDDIDIVSIWALDADGLIISDGSPENVMQDEKPEEIISIIDRIKVSRQFEIVRLEEELHITSPILTFNQELIGFVHMEISSARTDQQVQSNLIALLGISFILFVTGMLVAYFSAKKLVAPVSEIRDATNKIAEGNFNIQLPIQGKDELAQLSYAINDMCRNLKSTTVSKNYVKNIIDSMSDCLFVVDEKEDLVTINQTLFDTFGYDDNELIGNPVNILFDNKAALNLNDILDGNEVTFITKKGISIPFNLSLTPLISTGEGKNWTVGVAQDIREKKTTEKALQQAVIAAEAAAIAKSQFLSTMSHEIRTPMNGVLGMAQLLEDTPLNDEQKEYVDTIIHSGDNLLTIINNILDFTKLDVDMMNLEIITFDLERVCKESLELLSAKSSEKNLELILDYHPDCPINFKGDPSRLRQIILNLLGNAIKFTQKGYIRLGVSCHIQHSTYHLRFEIEDTGIGLENSALEHLFEEFTQADQATTRKFGGTGLGLAITNRLVKLMDGDIGVNSEPGAGSTFWFHINLPVADSPQPLPASSLKDIRILLVDNNLESRRVFSRLLQHIGAETVVVEPPVNICSILQTAHSLGKPFNIVILDQKMPGESGLELGRNIRQQNIFDSLKLIMISSSVNKGDASTFIKAGFNAYLNKPCQREIFEKVLLAGLTHTTGTQLVTQHTIKDTSPHQSRYNSSYSASILVVEDIHPNRIIAQKILESMGLTVDLANDGQQALRAVKEKDYDLIFMDCLMPIMDGYQATHEIRRMELETGASRIPVIALTANASIDDRAKCEQAGMDDVVTKPFKRADLDAALHKWLNRDKESYSVSNVNQLESEDTGTIDLTIYQQLKQNMEEDFPVIIESLINSMQENIQNFEQLDNSLKQINSTDCLRWAHSLKSMAAQIGASQMQQYSLDIEQYLKSGETNDIFPTVEKLHAEFRKVLNILERQ